MAIKFDQEQLLTLSDATKLIPHGPHLATVIRWTTRGIRGIKLETCLFGGIRYTSKAAIQRFIDATTVAADVPQAPSSSCKQPAHKKRSCKPPRKGNSKKACDEAGIVVGGGSAEMRP